MGTRYSSDDPILQQELLRLTIGLFLVTIVIGYCALSPFSVIPVMYCTFWSINPILGYQVIFDNFFQIKSGMNYALTKLALDRELELRAGASESFNQQFNSKI